MLGNDLQEKYEHGFYGIIQPTMQKLYGTSAHPAILLYMTHAADHLFSVELRPDYRLLREGFDKMVAESQPECAFRRPMATNLHAQISLAKIASLGEESLGEDAKLQLADFMSGMKRNLESDHPMFIMAAISGALALSEMIMCPTHRGEFVTPYYIIRPKLVEEGILRDLDYMKGKGIKLPLSRYRIFQG